MSTDPETVFRALATANVDYVVVGGVALILQGSAYVTNDIDLVYDRTRANAQRIAEALKPFHPRPRGLDAALPFVFDAQTILSSQILTLQTEIGDIDLLGEISGVGTYAAVFTRSEAIIFKDLEIRTLTVDGLLDAKRSANREKDKSGILELEALQELRAAKDKNT